MTLAVRPAFGALSRWLATAFVFAVFAVLPMALAAGVAGWWGPLPFSTDSVSVAQTAVGASVIPCGAPAIAGALTRAREHATQVACSGNTGAKASVEGVHLTAPSRPEGR